MLLFFLQPNCVTQRWTDCCVPSIGDHCIDVGKPRFLLGPLAQSVEQLTLNQRVVGSIPTRPTNFSAIRLV